MLLFKDTYHRFIFLYWKWMISPKKFIWEPPDHHCTVLWDALCKTMDPESCKNWTFYSESLTALSYLLHEKKVVEFSTSYIQLTSSKLHASRYKLNSYTLYSEMEWGKYTGWMSLCKSQVIVNPKKNVWTIAAIQLHI